jgi:hypothetical protein
MDVNAPKQSACGCDWAHRHAGTLVDKVNCDTQDPCAHHDTVKIADVALLKTHYSGIQSSYTVFS